mgnify:CR=1 FL=1
MSKYFKNFVQDFETLNFDVYGLTPSFCNAIRRIMISEIETIGFRSSYNEESDIMIEKNTSSLHNEFLGHRLSLLPIHYPPKDIADYVKEKYEFIIDIVNNSDDKMDVTSKDIKILDKVTGKYLSEAQTRNFFPPGRISKDFILIDRLKPNQIEGTDGESLKIIMKADKDIGKTHSRYTPTCVSVLTNKIEESKVESAFKDILSKRKDTPSAEGVSFLLDKISLKALSTLDSSILLVRTETQVGVYLEWVFPISLSAFIIIFNDSPSVPSI